MERDFICKKENGTRLSAVFGAGDEARTRYLHLGKVALYRMSYTRGTSGIITENEKMSIAKFKFYEKFFVVQNYKPGIYTNQ